MIGSPASQRKRENGVISTLQSSGGRSTRCFVHPADPHAFPPFACALIAVGCSEDSHTMLLSILPLSSEFSPICPEKGALAFLEVVDVLTFVCTAVWPLVASLTVHAVVHPLAFVLPTILPRERALSLNVVVAEIPVIHGAIWPLEPPFSVFLSMGISSSVLGRIIPLLDCRAVLQVTLPFSHVFRLFGGVGPMTVSFSI
mmetsp:Transcript_36791/g.66701  ORF Transcript_36791/g.66701 Transcript_36791/m.66701 type:complete len:200 (+) Transcript_36791:20-619(+)